MKRKKSKVVADSKVITAEETFGPDGPEAMSANDIYGPDDIPFPGVIHILRNMRNLGVSDKQDDWIIRKYDQKKALRIVLKSQGIDPALLDVVIKCANATGIEMPNL